jgi:micrococcal nuclease
VRTWLARRRRGWWRGPLLLAAVVAAATLGTPFGCASGDDGPDGDGPVRARVVEVTDGDTIDVRLTDGGSESVRYIGVDTPESTPGQPLECFGKRAAAANERLVGGRNVILRFGPERRDDYGRLLAYVYLPTADDAPPRFVNAELVRRGFARSLTIAPNDARAPLFRRLERRAGLAGVGLWGVC